MTARRVKRTATLLVTVASVLSPARFCGAQAIKGIAMARPVVWWSWLRRCTSTLRET